MNNTHSSAELSQFAVSGNIVARKQYQTLQDYSGATGTRTHATIYAFDQQCPYPGKHWTQFSCLYFFAHDVVMRNSNIGEASVIASITTQVKCLHVGICLTRVLDLPDGDAVRFRVYFFLKLTYMANDLFDLKRVCSATAPVIKSFATLTSKSSLKPRQ